MALELHVSEDGSYSFSGRSMQITKDKNELLNPYGKMVSNYGKVLVLLPTDAQIQMLNQQIGNARFVRNDYLNQRNETYNTKGIILSPAEYKKHNLPKLKEYNDFLNLSDKFALESAIEHVDAAFKGYYKNIKAGIRNKKGKIAGTPKMASKFKPSGNKYTTKFTNDNIKLLEANGIVYLQLPKVGKVRFIMPEKETLKTILPKTLVLRVSLYNVMVIITLLRYSLKQL